MNAIDTALAEQRACLETLESGVCPSWHPRAGMPLSDSDRGECEQGLSDWVAEELEIMAELDRYDEIIERRRIYSESCGFDPTEPMVDGLFDFQRDCVRWALRKGRAALFQDCGLGKTVQQLEWARHVCLHTGGNAMIFTPLAVAQQTAREAQKFGIENVHIVRDGTEVQPGISITNYEMLEHFSPDRFAGIVLDESSCLKGHDRITRQKLTEFAAAIPFRLLCSATPAPNDHMELGTQAEFLGVMKRTEMLSMFFIHDGKDTAKWRLKGHGAKRFWEWVASWAVYMRRPSDLGYDDNGFILPPLNYHQHTVEAEWKSDYLFPVEAKTLSERRDARRDSLSERVAKCAELVNATDDQWIIWCGLNDESAALTASIEGAVEVKGADSIEHKESAMLGFATGDVQRIVTKASISGFGMNWQNCHKMAFVGLSDSWEEIYQATRRCWRFGQDNPVDVHVIVGELEGAVVRNIQRKEEQAAEMADGMLIHMKDINADEIHGTRRKTTEYRRDVAHGKNWTLHLADCVDVAREIEEDSIDFQVFSPPFASLYTYSNKERDMGNCRGYEDFFAQYRFLVREQFRICKPGRLVSIHCMDLPLMKERDGMIGLRDFPGDLLRSYEGAGFVLHSRVVIWKDPLIEATRTKALGLAHKQIVKDAAMCRQGLPDYLITMRKPGENPDPVSHGPSGFDRYIGEMPNPKDRFDKDPSKNKYSHMVWQRYASPVWFDINPSDTLQYESARENDDERHICPLQLQVIERAMELWTNPGDLVFSPFAGIGSEGWVALRSGRRFVGAELKESYWRVACRNLEYAEGHFQGGLFA